MYMAPAYVWTKHDTRTTYSVTQTVATIQLLVDERTNTTRTSTKYASNVTAGATTTSGPRTAVITTPHLNTLTYPTESIFSYYSGFFYWGFSATANSNQSSCKTVCDDWSSGRPPFDLINRGNADPTDPLGLKYGLTMTLSTIYYTTSPVSLESCRYIPTTASPTSSVSLTVFSSVKAETSEIVNRPGFLTTTVLATMTLRSTVNGDKSQGAGFVDTSSAPALLMTTANAAVTGGRNVDSPVPSTTGGGLTFTTSDSSRIATTRAAAIISEATSRGEASVGLTTADTQAGAVATTTPVAPISPSTTSDSRPFVFAGGDSTTNPAVTRPPSIPTTLAAVNVGGVELTPINSASFIAPDGNIIGQGGSFIITRGSATSVRVVLTTDGAGDGVFVIGPTANAGSGTNPPASIVTIPTAAVSIPVSPPITLTVTAGNMPFVATASGQFVAPDGQTVGPGSTVIVSGGGGGGGGGTTPVAVVLTTNSAGSSVFVVGPTGAGNGAASPSTVTIPTIPAAAAAPASVTPLTVTAGNIPFVAATSGQFVAPDGKTVAPGSTVFVGGGGGTAATPVVLTTNSVGSSVLVVGSSGAAGLAPTTVTISRQPQPIASAGGVGGQILSGIGSGPQATSTGSGAAAGGNRTTTPGTYASGAGGAAAVSVRASTFVVVGTAVLLSLLL